MDPHTPSWPFPFPRSKFLSTFLSRALALRIYQPSLPVPLYHGRPTSPWPNLTMKEGSYEVLDLGAPSTIFEKHKYKPGGHWPLMHEWPLHLSSFCPLMQNERPRVASRGRSFDATRKSEPAHSCHAGDDISGVSPAVFHGHVVDCRFQTRKECRKDDRTRLDP